MAHRFLIYSILMVVMPVLPVFLPSDPIKLFRDQTVSLPVDHVQHVEVDFKDPAGKDTLFVNRSAEDHPVSYYADINTVVCADDKCRPLNIRIHWNITGRYLGFELPEKEFLSKTDHEPFVEADYQRMDSILADSLSPLSMFTYAELAAPPDRSVQNIDGITSATSRNVLKHVVPGAAYTTYTLWHLIYGQAQQHVTRITEQSLTAELALLILRSADSYDKVWALDHISGIILPSQELNQQIFALINDDNFTLAERAIQSFDQNSLQMDSVQTLLLGKFFTTGYSLQNLILKKLREATALDDGVALTLADDLYSMNGELLGNTLDLFAVHKISDEKIVGQIAKLLDNENRFISNKAYQFLKKSETQHGFVKELLKKYNSMSPSQ